MQKPIEKPIKFVRNLLTKGKSYPITHTEAVIDNNGNTLSLILENGVSGGGITKTTWQELKDLRDNSQLTPGALYRITDYNCTTTQEDTQSAGHQFDIVLLALSEDKLAEEGWAMEHPTDVYDVTFSDGVTKKCYLWIKGIREGNYYGSLVDCNTFMGNENIDTSIDNIDTVNKKFTINQRSDIILSTENVQYNYFQYSNLSAWKVWYCLDNDTARFAWADVGGPDKVELEGSTTMYKVPLDVVVEQIEYYAWAENEDETDVQDCYFTISREPSVGDDVYYGSQAGMRKETGVSVAAYIEGRKEGTGVIYRLIDEWNNDVPYDFKNIQFIRPMTDGEYDPDGEDTWVYTYTQYDSDNNILVDTSLGGGMMDGFIGIYNGAELSNNVILNPAGYNIKLAGTASGYCTISNSYGLLLFSCDALEIDGVSDAIYIGGKKVLTEE